MRASAKTAFDEARNPLPDLATTAEEPEAPDAAEAVRDAVPLAISLLRAIAEDVLVRPSHRIGARRHLKRLRRTEAEPA